MNTPRFIECIDPDDDTPLLFNIAHIRLVYTDSDGGTTIKYDDGNGAAHLEIQQSITEVKALIEHATGYNVIGLDDCDY